MVHVPCKVGLSFEALTATEGSEAFSGDSHMRMALQPNVLETVSASIVRVYVKSEERMRLEKT